MNRCICSLMAGLDVAKGRSKGRSKGRDATPMYCTTRDEGERWEPGRTVLLHPPVANAAAKCSKRSRFESMLGVLVKGGRNVDGDCRVSRKVVAICTKEWRG